MSPPEEIERIADFMSKKSMRQILCEQYGESRNVDYRDFAALVVAKLPDVRLNNIRDTEDAVLEDNDSPAPKKYILRVPRFDATQLERNLAPLQLLHQRSDLAVPEVIVFDTPSDNALESPYMIQIRLPGSDLYSTFPTIACVTLIWSPATFSSTARHPLKDMSSAVFSIGTAQFSPLHSYDEDERLANDTSPTPELRKVKQLFEDAAGLAYARFAYPVQYRLAHRLVRFATDGLRSSEGFVDAELFLQEWTELRSDLEKGKERH
ncbi:hypothetical protein G7Y89_g3301 [Cudoniella acicularis]|uniref:Uncharacterized protein n=1 Tax=Cudoniella acicularis TaxID=354080 RepID=A0A8H4RSX5_9HELO|nr:hypothetical protein G7Y89_g3301 [Cudoniella acicularis]